jgi:hypothetical protein
MRRYAGWIAAVALLAGAMSASAELAAAKLSWPGIGTVWQHGTMFMSSNPSAKGLGHAKGEGVATVIDLRQPSEQAWNKPLTWWDRLGQTLGWNNRWNEPQAAAMLGMRYENVPVAVEAPTNEAVARFLAICKEVDQQKLLIHCDIGGRALAMWAIYLGTVKGYTPEAALAQAEAAGLKHAGLKRFVLGYLQKPTPA